jgi:hypothetical protein
MEKHIKALKSIKESLMGREGVHSISWIDMERYDEASLCLLGL